MAWEVRQVKAKEQHRRQPCWQLEAREMERAIRKSAVAFSRWMGRRGSSVEEAARRAGLAASTLTEWERSWKEGRLEPEPRGRKMERSDPETRNLVIAVFQLAGPGVSIRALMELFPDVSRRELEDLQRRYQHTYRRRGALLIHALRWQRVGAVWAMDFTEAPSPVDGVYPWILAVRDLGSGKLLLSLPVTAETAANVRDALRALFIENGKPLVIKSDNGSHFVAEEMRRFLIDENVVQLLSPPGIPAYNGACEAGIGSLKTRAHEESARHDRPGEWTCDDVEGARLMANETARPQGLLSPTPDEFWNNRLPITPEERAAFLEELRKRRAEARVEQGFLPGVELSQSQEDAIDRVAISRALVARCILKFRRRRISPPINFARAANNS